MNADSLISDLVETALSVATAVLPLAALFLVFQIFMLKLPRRDVRDILLGTLLSAVGLFLFLFGVAIGFLPVGTGLGEALGSLTQKWWLVPAGLFLGFVTTWGEPAVRILADQVEDASSGSLRSTMVVATISIGVALWVGLGLLRIAFGIPLLYLLVPGYLLVLVFLRYSDPEFVGIAADASGVATGPMANTFLLALALGLSSAGGRDPFIDGLGLVSLISLAPLISVMAMGFVLRRKTRKDR